MSRWLATEGNVEAQIKANKNKLEKCFDTVVLDNQDLTLRLSTVTPAGSPAGVLSWCRTRTAPGSCPYIANGVAEDEVRRHRLACTSKLPPTSGGNRVRPQCGKEAPRRAPHEAPFRAGPAPSTGAPPNSRSQALFSAFRYQASPSRSC